MSHKKVFGKIFLLFLVLAAAINAQWVNNPASNNKITSDLVNPTNLKVVEDQQGGAFLVWEENKSSNHNDIYYLHLDKNGSPTFRNDGKNVSLLRSKKKLPEVILLKSGVAFVAWLDVENNKSLLKAQRVDATGTILNSSDIIVSDANEYVTDYALKNDDKGNVLVCYVVKRDKKYSVEYLKLNSEGQRLVDKPILVSENSRTKTSTFVQTDNNGGAYCSWIESESKISLLAIQKVSASNIVSWKSDLTIQNSNYNIFAYDEISLKNGSLYLAWQIQETGKSKKKTIYNQIITAEGKKLLNESNPLLNTNRMLTNPQALAIDDNIYISWVQDEAKARDIYLQKLSSTGDFLWKSPLAITKISGAQFGQRLLPDVNNGVLICWVDMRTDSSKGDIYAQKITSDGKFIWESNGIPLATYKKSEKSYQNVISDNEGGAIVFFKEKRNNKEDIYGQKVFNTGAYISPITNFDLEIAGDSVRVTFKLSSSDENITYNIEYADKPDVANSKWAVLNSYKGNKNTLSYSYYTVPPKTGAVYFRITQKDTKNNFTSSEVKSINYFKSENQIVVGQNVPNPFSKTTKISFYLPQRAHIKVEFFSSNLEKIQTVEDTYNSGKNEIIFDGSSLPDGVYFYKFTSGSFSEVMKMLISR